MVDMPDPHALDDLREPHWQDGDVRLATSSPDDLGVEELRLLISRQKSLGRHVPRALDLLEANPLAEGDYYPGDLLHAVLQVDIAYWRANRSEWERAHEIAESLAFAQSRLSDALQTFRTRRI
jgi:CDI immunity proteins